LRQPVQRPPDHLGHVAFAGMVGDGLVGQFVGGVLLQLAPPPPGNVRIDHRASDVVVDGGAVVDLAPGEIGLGQRGLDQILGVRPVAGQHERRPEQRGLAIVDIFAEIDLVRGTPGLGHGLRSRLSVIAHDAHAIYLT
jgi:hypothetical protein